MTTTGGNSGSCVVDITSGEVVGLHFAGDYLKTNYAASMYDLAKDTRLVDTGVNFVGDAEPSSEPYGRIWESIDEEGLANLGDEGLFSKKVDPTPLLPKFSIKSLFDQEQDEATYLSAALGSYVAYMDEKPLKKVVENDWGFDSCVLLQGGSTECFLAQHDDKALVVFRGTELKLNEWLRNLNMLSTKTDYGNVHSGFLSAYQQIKEKLRTELSERNIKSLVLSGHSLGGALAVITVMDLSEWFAENGISIKNVFTFGQPAVGKSNFVSELNTKMKGKYHRFVNNNDIVSRLPPTYKHTGLLYHFDKNRDLLSSNSEGVASPLDEVQDAMLTYEAFEIFRADIEGSLDSTFKCNSV